MEYLEDGRTELFNLRTDPSESRDIASKSAEKVEAMRKELVNWRKALNAAMPIPKQDAEQQGSEPKKKRSQSKGKAA